MKKTSKNSKPKKRAIKGVNSKPFSVIRMTQLGNHQYPTQSRRFVTGRSAWFQYLVDVVALAFVLHLILRALNY